MQEFPETRDSLLVRIQDAADHQAWIEFVAIYRPLVYRLARRRGMQDADAQDVAQKVLIAVAGKMRDWETDCGRGRFRSWLSRVARNATIDAFRRLRPDAAAGGTSVLERLGQQPTQSEGSEDELEREYRREVFRWAARQIHCEFEQVTWLSFWMTTVEAKPIGDVAAQLGKTVGAVYTARSRVMSRLKDKVREYEKESG